MSEDVARSLLRRSLSRALLREPLALPRCFMGTVVFREDAGLGLEPLGRYKDLTERSGASYASKKDGPFDVLQLVPLRFRALPRRPRKLPRKERRPAKKTLMTGGVYEPDDSSNPVRLPASRCRVNYCPRRRRKRQRGPNYRGKKHGRSFEPEGLFHAIGGELNRVGRGVKGDWRRGRSEGGEGGFAVQEIEKRQGGRGVVEVKGWAENKAKSTEKRKNNDASKKNTPTDTDQSGRPKLNDIHGERPDEGTPKTMPTIFGFVFTSTSPPVLPTPRGPARSLPFRSFIKSRKKIFPRVVLYWFWGAVGGKGDQAIKRNSTKWETFMYKSKGNLSLCVDDEAYRRSSV
ncbi:hypothetical protein GWI33_007297 [Rhynchophorus ferrugineus]|uniref:Uncharacterized protein n=1 Tax=Rhynchophorus ferrugineus TaxID=354439 RepID=A0A834IHU9_RHYFE|nr:hypothetical protein GWI33_007297 [Rhynchophorus ferrugineus]